MAPTRAVHLLSELSARPADALADKIYVAGPVVARTLLSPRDTTTIDPTSGTISPHSINNNGMFALFGILGAAICVGIIWFFFWAKNGGFHFKDNDWDDYKSTVLRRTGPNGTILSNATASTKLGGGSVYKDVNDYTEDSTTVVTASSGSTEMSGVTAGASDIVGREKRRKKREQREREKEKERDRRRGEKSRERRDKKDKKERTRRQVNEEGVLIDDNAEAEAKAQLRNYRNEKAARVGGLNRESDSSAWDGSTNPSSSAVGTESTVTSELIPNREVTPTSTPTKKKRSSVPPASGGGGGGIRKVYSTADRNEVRENERLRREARRQERERDRERERERERERVAPKRRDFSWQHGEEDASTHLRQIEEGSSHVDDVASEVPGAWQDNASESDLGTKSYQHYIPGLSSIGSAVEPEDDGPEDRRKERQRRNGFRH